LLTTSTLGLFPQVRWDNARQREKVDCVTNCQHFNKDCVTNCQHFNKDCVTNCQHFNKDCSLGKTNFYCLD